MPYDRRNARVFLAMMGLVGVALSVGCMRSSNLRTSAGTLPELSPTGELHPVAGEATAARPGTPAPTGTYASWIRGSAAPPARPATDPGTTLPATMPSPVPGAANPVGASGPAGPLPTSPAPVGEPAPSPTPLIDAEIRRVQAINRQHIESLKAADTPTPVVAPFETPTDRTASPAPSATTSVPNPVEPDLDVLAPLPLAATIQVAVEPETAKSSSGSAVPPLIPIDPPTAGSVSPETAPAAQGLTADRPEPSPVQVVRIVDASSVNDPNEVPMPIRPVSSPDEMPMPTRTGSGSIDEPDAVTQPAEEARPASGAPPPRTDDQEERPPLEIAALRLCSNVKDFGWVEPVNPEALKPGQRVRVYCEMAGLKYRPRGDALVSRLAAHLELRSGTDGPVVWEQAMGTAEDLCHRRRRDYYVSYEVKVPQSLEPGPYRLRLIQTDLVSNHAASSEISVTIVR